ncbi:melanoma-associated antigen 10-like [Sorex fumeus]|uniref:melanoma-associated antigen 10-like n=1 Tax=Sorex fumeus TaxID=62283 RepID=UPI0024ADC9CC|nr:melanoma-associated antigen 10-like [Sorex fumeus]
MSFHKKYLACKLEKKRQSLSEAQSLEDEQFYRADQEMPTSACASSSPRAFGSFNVSTPASPSILYPGTLEEDVAAGIPYDPQKPSRALLSSRTMADSPQSQLEESDSSEEEGPRSHQELGKKKYSLIEEALFGKMADLVGFLLFKYRSKEPTSEAEIQSQVLTSYKDYFPIIFSQASECLQLIFGIEVQEADPQGHSYVLVTNLDFISDAMGNPEQDMPKTGLLMMVLAIILLEGDCSSEENVWESLTLLGVQPGKEHFIYGEPRELLTKVWVQEQYLEYRQVPGSHPVRYMFLWGPRAHAQTSKSKILELWVKLTSMDPRCFLALWDMNEETT